MTAAIDREAIIRSYFSITNGEDFPSLANYFAEEAVLELPLRPKPGSRRYAGLAEITEVFGNYPGIFKSPHNFDIKVHLFQDSLGALVFWSGDHELTNGNRYRNDFLGVFEFNADGKIVKLSEYYDPTVVAKLWADNPDLYTTNLWETAMGAKENA